MQELDLLVKIAEIILFAALTILCIYLIVSVKKITKTADNINVTVETLGKNFEELKSKVEPLIVTTNAITADVKDITTDIKTQVSKVDDIVDSFKDTADSIIQFEQKAQREIEVQVFDTINLISAITKGVKTFFTYFSASKNGSPRLSSTGRQNKSYSSSEDSSEEDFYQG
ncbi:MAG TPA: DUF948 domain-containing protein [Ignavibacteria bacterium]|jgi:uncharacterized protein YoxC